MHILLDPIEEELFTLAMPKILPLLLSPLVT